MSHLIHREFQGIGNITFGIGDYVAIAVSANKFDVAKIKDMIDENYFNVEYYKISRGKIVAWQPVWHDKINRKTIFAVISDNPTNHEIQSIKAVLKDLSV